MQKSHLLCAICLLTFGITASVQASVFNVTFTDNDGPQWTGQVDTAADTVLITSWTENPGGSIFWTPSALPLVWDAVDSSGTGFDVPDNWDGTIDTTWGFLSPVILNSISFNEGTFPNAPIKPGWGILENAGTIDANTSEVIINLWPVSADLATASIADNVEISPIPLPPAAYLFGSGILGLIGIARKKLA